MRTSSPGTSSQDVTDVGTASVLEPPQRAVLAAYAQVAATRSTDPLLGRGRAAHRRLVTGSLPPNRGQLLKHPRNDNLPPPMPREKTGDLFDTDVETLSAGRVMVHGSGAATTSPPGGLPPSGAQAPRWA